MTLHSIKPEKILVVSVITPEGLVWVNETSCTANEHSEDYLPPSEDHHSCLRKLFVESGIFLRSDEDVYYCECTRCYSFVKHYFITTDGENYLCDSCINNGNCPIIPQEYLNV